MATTPALTFSVTTTGETPSVPTSSIVVVTSVETVVNTPETVANTPDIVTLTSTLPKETTSGPATAINSSASSGSNPSTRVEASSTPSAPSASDINRTNSLATGAKAGIGVAIAIVVLLTIAAALWLWRKKRKRLTPSNGATEFDDKAEMYAGPVDQTIAGTVKRKHELPTRSSTLATGKHVHEAHGTPRSELNAQSSRKAGSQQWSNCLPPEVDSTHLQELGVNSLQQGIAPATEAHVTTTSDTSTVVGSSTSNEKPAAIMESSPFDDTELEEDADAAVQELGLISVRRRALVNSAKNAGVAPEAVSGRKGEEYRELLERESKVRARLEEIEKLRSCG